MRLAMLLLFLCAGAAAAAPPAGMADDAMAAVFAGAILEQAPAPEAAAEESVGPAVARRFHPINFAASAAAVAGGVAVAQHAIAEANATDWHFFNKAAAAAVEPAPPPVRLPIPPPPTTPNATRAAPRTRTRAPPAPPLLYAAAALGGVTGAALTLAAAAGLACVRKPQHHNRKRRVVRIASDDECSLMELDGAPRTAQTPEGPPEAEMAKEHAALAALAAFRKKDKTGDDALDEFRIALDDADLAEMYLDSPRVVELAKYLA